MKLTIDFFYKCEKVWLTEEEFKDEPGVTVL